MTETEQKIIHKLAKELCTEVHGCVLFQARGKCAMSGVRYRIVEQDGVPSVVTQDYRLDRVNLRVHRGIVTEAFVG